MENTPENRQKIADAVVQLLDLNELVALAKETVLRDLENPEYWEKKVDEVTDENENILVQPLEANEVEPEDYDGPENLLDENPYEDRTKS